VKRIPTSQNRQGGRHEAPSQPSMPNSSISFLLRKRSGAEDTDNQAIGRPQDRGSASPQRIQGLRSNGEMRKLLNRKIVSQNRKCALCGAEFTDYSDVVPDHINPRGMGGAWRDDHPDNIQAVHWWCNGEKGSTRI
jgi:5-methylcytosine-specific restriction endonuclease McrA